MTFFHGSYSTLQHDFQDIAILKNLVNILRIYKLSLKYSDSNPNRKVNQLPTLEKCIA